MKRKLKRDQCKIGQVGYVYQRAIELEPHNLIDYIFRGSGLHQVIEELEEYCKPKPAPIPLSPSERKKKAYQHDYYIRVGKARRLSKKGKE